MGDDTWSSRRLCVPYRRARCRSERNERGEKPSGGTRRGSPRWSEKAGAREREIGIERAREREGRSEVLTYKEERGRLALCHKPPAREHSSGKYP
ncbi:hypothetical protein KM043_004610 [Ampulex compressa]|nr:hypothetical protein KM043_004610 [Ampulex compressa]